METKKITLRSQTVQCPHCGEYYSVTYKYCPFCDAGRQEEERKLAEKKKKKQAFFAMDFIVDEDSLYRLHVKIRPKSGEKYQNSDIAVTIKKVHITKADSYESCSKRLDKMISEQSDSYIEELDKIEGLSWLFEYPSNSEISYSVHNLESDKSYLRILEYTCLLYTSDAADD